MFLYEIRSYVDTSSIALRFLTIKQFGDKHFSKIFNIYIPTLVNRILSLEDFYETAQNLYLR